MLYLHEITHLNDKKLKIVCGISPETTKGLNQIQVWKVVLYKSVQRLICFKMWIL